MMIFDSHAHLISDDTLRYPPAPFSGTHPPPDLEHPMTAEELLREMNHNGVARAVLVQRGSIYGYDNSYVCESAAKYSDRLVAICAINAASPEGPGQVHHWVGERGAVGIRLMEPVKGAPLSWLASAQAMQVWHAAQARDVPVCVHFFRWNRDVGLLALRKILEQLPDLTVVIDHFSNMAVQSGPPHFGLDEPLLELTRFPNVYTKFTTVPLGQLDKAGTDVAPIVARVVAAFGAKRVMWGSDITQSKGSYAYMVGLANRATASLNETDRNQVLYESANGVYGSKLG
jgi:L-fuconolactonase